MTVVVDPLQLVAWPPSGRGHHRLLLHMPSGLGIASPTTKFCAGLTTQARLNQGLDETTQLPLATCPLG